MVGPDRPPSAPGQPASTLAPTPPDPTTPATVTADAPAPVRDVGQQRDQPVARLPGSSRTEAAPTATGGAEQRSPSPARGTARARGHAAADPSAARAGPGRTRRAPPARRPRSASPGSGRRRHLQRHAGGSGEPQDVAEERLVVGDEHRVGRQPCCDSSPSRRPVRPASGGAGWARDGRCSRPVEAKAAEHGGARGGPLARGDSQGPKVQTWGDKPGPDQRGGSLG